MSRSEEVADTTEAEAKKAKAEQEKIEKRNRAAAWLEENWTGIRQCPVCTTNQWTVGDIVELRLFEGGGLVVGGPVYPLVPVICNKCGNTFLINAITAGVLLATEDAGADPSP